MTFRKMLRLVSGASLTLMSPFTISTIIWLYSGHYGIWREGPDMSTQIGMVVAIDIIGAVCFGFTYLES